MKTVLITGIGGDVGQGIATILREQWPGCRRIGIDIHERHGGGLFVDQFLVAPPVSHPSYNAWLGDVIVREEVHICIPTSEAELIHLSGKGLSALGPATLVMANPTAIAVGSDKLRTSEFLATAGIPAPWTVPAEAFGPEVALPCIFKPRRSAGSKGIFVCRSPDDVVVYRDRYPAAVLQELLLPADREVTCAVYRDRSGAIAVLQLLRTLVGGFTGWAQAIDDAEVAAQCRRIAEALDLRGSINVQLRLTETGPRIFEINPRFSSTVLIRHRMGFCDLVWSVQEALGETVTFHQPASGTIGVRVQGAAVVGAR